MSDKDLIESILNKCKEEAKNLMTQDEYIECAESGWDGNTDDAFESGRRDGNAEMASEILNMIKESKGK